MQAVFCRPTKAVKETQPWSKCNEIRFSPRCKRGLVGVKNQTMKRAFLLYEMDYKTWNSNFRDELTKGDREYKKWFFSHASKLTLSYSLYSEIFISNPIFSTGLFHAALNSEQSLIRDDAESEEIFFALYPGSFL